MQSEPSVCTACGAPAVSVPGLTIHQERHYDCARRHAVALCAGHGAALQRGDLALHELVFDWAQRHHAELYDGMRLMLRVELNCLACNAALPEPVNDAQTVLPCSACDATNMLGSALGHPAVVRLA